MLIGWAGKLRSRGNKHLRMLVVLLCSALSARKTNKTKLIRTWYETSIDKLNNFQMYSVGEASDLGTPYDYKSIMHYGRTAFAQIRGQDTIVPIPDENVEIGQRSGMSYIDVWQVMKTYKCPTTPFAGKCCF